VGVTHCAVTRELRPLFLTRERDYLLRNARAGRLDYAKARRAKMPIGRGTMESAVRRVVNLRLKGAGNFRHKEHAEQMLLLRTYYNSKHWQVHINKAFAVPLAEKFVVTAFMRSPARPTVAVPWEDPMNRVTSSSTSACV